jgi:hypothetical protein
MTGFKWSERRRRAADLLADGELTEDEVAAKLGIRPKVLRSWLKLPDFAARIEAQIIGRRRALLRRGLARVETRIRALEDRWRKLIQIAEERAALPEMADIPGGRTGFLISSGRLIGRKDDLPVYLHELDSALLKELRDHERQAAQELGQWTEGETANEIPKLCGLNVKVEDI